jgi:hypothetical protein
MLLNFAFCIVGCTVLALVNVASFLYGLGCDTRSMTGGVPFWVLLLAAAVLPLLACVCCFYASLSVGEKSASQLRQPIRLERIAIEPAEPVRVAELVAR